MKEQKKICSNPKCHKADISQPLENFHRRKNGKFGRSPICKVCFKEKDVIRKQKKKEKLEREKRKANKPKKHTICSLCGKQDSVLQGHNLDYNDWKPLLVCGDCNRIIKRLRAFIKNKEKNETTI